MSRSYKKTPKGFICGIKADMSWWKKAANRTVRRSTKDLSDGNEYRKIEDTWGSPGDGPKIWKPTDKPKFMRK